MTLSKGVWLEGPSVFACSYHSHIVLVLSGPVPYVLDLAMRTVRMKVIRLILLLIAF